MIPKIIHYCWFGGNEKSELVKKCIETWEKYLPEYEIIEWNESNFDVNCCEFTKRAYENRKWAFVADYARLKALKEHGGIYLDTDIELVKPFDEYLLHHQMFTCFEDLTHISTGCVGAVANHEVLNKFIDIYYKYFDEEDNKGFIPNTEILSSMLFPNGVETIDNIAELENITIYTRDYFLAKDYVSGKVTKTDNTYCIHHYDGTWKSGKDKFFDKIKLGIRRIIGEKRYNSLKKKIKTK